MHVAGRRTNRTISTGLSVPWLCCDVIASAAPGLCWEMGMEMAHLSVFGVRPVNVTVPGSPQCNFHPRLDWAARKCETRPDFLGLGPLLLD